MRFITWNVQNQDSALCDHPTYTIKPFCWKSPLVSNKLFALGNKKATRKHRKQDCIMSTENNVKGSLCSISCATPAFLYIDPPVSSNTGTDTLLTPSSLKHPPVPPANGNRCNTLPACSKHQCSLSPLAGEVIVPTDALGRRGQIWRREKEGLRNPNSASLIPSATGVQGREPACSAGSPILTVRQSYTIWAID